VEEAKRRRRKGGGGDEEEEEEEEEVNMRSNTFLTTSFLETIVCFNFVLCELVS